MDYIKVLILAGIIFVLGNAQVPFPVVVPPGFYNFGPDVGDSVAPVNDDGSTGEIPIAVAFPFYNQIHDHLFVSTFYVCFNLFLFHLISICL